MRTANPALSKSYTDVPMTAKKYAFPAMGKDAVEYPDGTLVTFTWINVLQAIQALTEDDKKELLKALKLEDISAQESKFVFTSDKAAVLTNGSKVFIDGAGDLTIWDNAVSGQSFLVIDPLNRLEGQSSKIIAPTGQTIGKGQFKSGVEATSELVLSRIDSGYLGGGIRFVLDSSGKNWAIDLSACAFTPVGSPSAVLPSFSLLDVLPKPITTIDEEIFVLAGLN